MGGYLTQFLCFHYDVSLGTIIGVQLVFGHAAEKKVPGKATQLMH